MNGAVIVLQPQRNQHLQRHRQPLNLRPAIPLRLGTNNSMVAKFCANCGGGLGPADKFCPQCGIKVITACPTCGQAWDGVSVGEVLETKTKAQPIQEKPVVNTTKTPTKEIREVVATTIPPSVVGLVYGPSYDSAKDCANCGMAGNKKACDSCGSGSNK